MQDNALQLRHVLDAIASHLSGRDRRNLWQIGTLVEVNAPLVDSAARGCFLGSWARRTCSEAVQTVRVRYVTLLKPFAWY